MRTLDTGGVLEAERCVASLVRRGHERAERGRSKGATTTTLSFSYAPTPAILQVRGGVAEGFKAAVLKGGTKP